MVRITKWADWLYPIEAPTIDPWQRVGPHKMTKKMVSFARGTFVTGKKKTNCTTLPEETTLETINTRLRRAKEKKTFAVGK
ncbi:hypothetical protein L5515_012522 [Caenorhabditis briggsae]|uniref:Uncharacterized protein n=1 Tax=Caenorhabditis briggsae TaxID=6238 RepID=A0AAE9EYF7_CAEBR|nr:hypothetical protein L5515_012522 [Caenorhabditis briggsae]